MSKRWHSDIIHSKANAYIARMGITSSKERNAIRYSLYEDAARFQLHQIACRWEYIHTHNRTLEGTVDQPHKVTSTGQRPTSRRELVATKASHQSRELEFDNYVLNEATDNKDAPANADGLTAISPRPDRHNNYDDADHLARGAGVVVSWLCDPAAKRKTNNTSFLNIQASGDETLSIHFKGQLKDHTLKNSRFSIALTSSPEELDRVLLERKRGNVSSQDLITYSPIAICQYHSLPITNRSCNTILVYR